MKIPSKIDIKTLPALNAKINKKAISVLPNDLKSQISVMLQQTKNKYQNFIITQA